MINKGFYPTPVQTTTKLVSGLKGKEDSYSIRLLEPSAGSGNILDYLNENNHRYDLFCIEKEPELQAILRDKGYKLLDDDFLTYIPDCTFDAIVMNPPFDTCTKHFLKAWEIASDTEIRCLLPEEVINNPYTEERKLITRIIEDNGGTVEILGDCFRHAERTTNVNVVLVSIYRKEKNEHNFEYTKHMDQEKQYDIHDLNKTDVANTDVFGNLEIRYNKVREGIKKMLELKNEIDYYGGDILDDGVFNLFTNHNCGDLERYNKICDDIRKSAWKKIFNNTKMGDIVTTKTRDNINKLQEQQGHMAFTSKNMEKLYSDLFQNMDTIMQDCIIESFDLLTKYHKENRCYIEGWKTNERFYVGQKFILPRSIDHSWYGHYKYIHLEYSRQDDLVDIEKALCFVTGKKFEDILSISERFRDESIDTYNKWYDSTFFQFKCFKKGTMHFKFNTEQLWNKFNITACKGKNWIGF